MKFNLATVVPLFALVASSMGFSVTSRAVYLNGQESFTLQHESDEVHRISLDSLKDVLSVASQIGGLSIPHQLLYVFSNGEGLDHAVFPDFEKEQRIASAKVLVSKIPVSLLAQDRIFVSVVAANGDNDEANLDQPIVELIPSEELKTSLNYKAPARLGAKPEIHHIFSSDQATVNPIVPVAFSAVAALLLVALFGSWATSLGDSLFGASHGSSVKTGLLVVLASFEYTFVKYYLGATIFTTIFHVAILSVPALIIGSKALSQLAKLRSTASA